MREPDKDKLKDLSVKATPLSAEEQELRSQLEHQVKTSPFQAGLALTQLQQLRLYRSTHASFEAFCQDTFSFSRDYAYLKMGAARVYQNLQHNLPTDGQHLPLPSRERQLRPIVKAKLDDLAQVEVWSTAVALAEGKIPSSSIVAEAVRIYRAEHNSVDNPFSVGEICRIVVRDNSKLKGKGGCWCIVGQVDLTSCTVNTWSDEFEVPVENLESLKFDSEQYQAIEDVGVRMTQLHETGRLDQAALWVLDGLARLDRPYLTDLEEKLLQLLEQEYGCFDS